MIDQWAGTVTDYSYAEPQTSVDDVASAAAVTSVQTRPNGAQANAADGFDGADYSSGAGWTGPWVETGDGAVSDATTGNIVLTGGALELTGVVSGQAPVVSRQLAATGALTAVVDVDVSRGTQALEAGDVVRVRVVADGDAQRTVSETVTGDTLTGTPGTVSVDATALLPATSLTVEVSVVSGVVDTDANGPEVVRVGAVNVGINTPGIADTFTYDKAGRMVSRTVDGATTTLQWDVLSNLVGTSGKGGTRWYVYDASGQRVAQVREPGAGPSGPVPGTASVYLGSTEASDTDTGTPGVGVSATRYYAVGGATVATLHVENGVQAWALMLGDSQGSAQVMVDLVVSATATGFAPITSAGTGVTRTAYMPYGSGRGTGELSIDRGWLGQVEDDDTGLVYLNARYYDPVLGRFLSPDPLLNPGDPRTLDPYRYADNNPVVFTDASGLRPACASGGARDQDACYYGTKGVELNPILPNVFEGGGNREYDRGMNGPKRPHIIVQPPTRDDASERVIEGVYAFVIGDDMDQCRSGSGVAKRGMGCAMVGSNFIPGVGEGKWGLKAGGKFLKWLTRGAKHADDVAEARKLPDLVLDSGQFGDKIGKHAHEFGLDPGDPAAREWIQNRIVDIHANPSEVRQGPWHPNAGGGSDYLFFRQGQDVVLTKADGTFVTIMKDGATNKWFNGASGVS